ncbi:hypothetical protein CC77DRAFT_1094189 [Alternaria alternata]|uniref:Uncharacterized protein n=1 Tax=Alternaria alternata TaxID=5599 RepID=A0A177DNL4_ALTAL|nr:hypothetical protein CC77DRAFT_1094189 [Alternaria alternata]OAG20977.1 hypothetical protein CC77DRAFT_1094189 [Alternaria alternata]
MAPPETTGSHGSCASNNFYRLRAEWSHSPYRSDEIEAYNKPSDEVGTRATCCIVYIRNFLRTPHDFVYCIHGPANLVKFHSGLHGGDAYNGPVLASVVSLLGQTVVHDGQRIPPICWNRFDRVRKQPGKQNKIRWSYMFETARLAWSKMTFDARSLQLLEESLATATNQIGYPETEETWGEGAISASQRTSQEARSIAIEMNLKLLKKKDDDDEILCFLKNELHGRQLRLQRHKLSDEQTRLLNQFGEILDEFDYLCSPDNPDDADSKAFERKKALLTTERDDLIKQIQYEITKPSEASDTARSSTSSLKSLQGEDEHMPVEQDQNTPMTKDEPTCLSESNLDAIREFCSVTFASVDHAKEVLAIFNYNLKEALDFHFEDQMADQKALDSADPKMDVDSEELARAVQSSLEPESEPPGGERNVAANDWATNYESKRDAQSPSEEDSTKTKGEEQLTEDTSRTGRSHAGQPILLDAQGNFKSHLHTEPPPKSLWEQYRAMRERLHVQYYGSSTWFDDPDPLRGVPARERAEHDDNAVSNVDTDNSGGHKDVEQEKAAIEYRADAEMAIKLEAEEREAQERRDQEHARSLHSQLNALDEAEQAANADGFGEIAEEMAEGTAATTLSNVTVHALGQNTQDNNDSTRNNHSPAQSEKDSVMGDDKAPFKMDLDRVMEEAEHNNRQKVEQGDTESNSFVDPRDLEKTANHSDDVEIEQRKYLFDSKEEGDGWYDSDRDRMDIYGKNMVGSESGAHGEEPTFTPSENRDAFMSSATDDKQQTFGTNEEEVQCTEKEKFDSPMVFKPNEDVDIDAEDDDVKILKVDEDDDVDMGGESSNY